LRPARAYNRGKNAYTHLAYGKFHAEVTLPAGLELDKVHCNLTMAFWISKFLSLRR